MVDVEREGPVARIFLNRPEKANALNSPALDALRRALRELAGDRPLRTVILGGRGRVRRAGNVGMHHCVEARVPSGREEQRAARVFDHRGTRDRRDQARFEKS